MKTSKMLLLFCSQNNRAILSKAELEKLSLVDAEIARITSHYEKFGVGVARRSLASARTAYVADPSDANRAALDKVRATWLAEDEENGAQRATISKVLTEICTRELRILLPPILRRAANALAWLALEVQFAEQAIHARFETPYTPSAIVESIKAQMTKFRVTQGRIDSERFAWNGRCSSYPECEWLPDLLQIEGEVWNLETLDPAAKRPADKWRNFGQIGNPLFEPLLCDGAAEVSVKGKAVKTYPAISPELAAALAPVQLSARAR